VLKNAPPHVPETPEAAVRDWPFATGKARQLSVVPGAGANALGLRKRMEISFKTDGWEAIGECPTPLRVSRLHSVVRRYEPKRRTMAPCSVSTARNNPVPVGLRATVQPTQCNLSTAPITL